MSDVLKLSGKVCLVTGASRGIGKGVAQELGAAGATVYLTARTLRGAGAYVGSAEETAQLINASGGVGVPIQCDHSDDAQVEAVFDRIREDHGDLDILVNNVLDCPELVFGPDIPGGTPFWEAPISAWGGPMNVGLRSHYVASVFAMPLLLEGGGLIVNISSAGAFIYFESVAYSVGKAALDRMTRDMAHEIGDRPVAIVSVWPGMVATEFAEGIFKEHPDHTAAYLRMASTRARETASKFSGTPIEMSEDYTPSAEDGASAWNLTESVRFTGRAVAALAEDPRVIKKTGRAFSVVGLAKEYGFTDVDGRRPDPFHFADTDAWTPLVSKSAA